MIGMVLIELKGIRKAYADHTVLNGVDLQVNEHDLIGLIGPNGTGKTTLANILYGSLEPDGGSRIPHKKDLTIGYLRQSSAYTETMMEAMLSGEMGGLRQAAGQMGMEDVFSWEAERAGTLSGGERTKLAFLQAWSARPHLLILDEPTNHLDMTGREWLIGEIQRYPGALLLISHDRYLLDRTANRIAEIEGGKVQMYEGGYAFYREEKARLTREYQRRYEKEEAEQRKLTQDIQQLKQWGQKGHDSSRQKALEKGGRKEYYRAKARKKDRQVKSKIKRLEKLMENRIEKPRAADPIHIAFDPGEGHGRRMIEAQGLGHRFGERVLFSEADFIIEREARVGIVGDNGSGKTTLLRLIAGDLTPTQGRLWVSPSARLGYLSQDVTDLPQGKSPLVYLQARYPERRDAGNVLGAIGLRGDLTQKPIEQLSIGQQMRVKLAQLAMEEVNLLLLDEPSNHLDIQSREEVGDALRRFPGTLLLVSHDRYLIEEVCTALLVLTDERIEYRGRVDFSASIAGSTEEGRVPADRLLLDTRIAALLGEMERLPRDSEAYARKEAELMELMRQR